MKTDPSRIIHDCNIEKEKLQDYHGRELLELLQNADDEAVDNLPKKVKISFKDKVLEVSNYRNGALAALFLRIINY